MNNKTKAFIIVLLALVLLIGAAALLYDKLSEEAAPNQLVSHGPASEESGEAEASIPSAGPETLPEAEEAAPTPGDTAPGETTSGETASKPSISKAPDFTVYDAEGNAVRLSDFYGKPVVLNFWASWCAPCRREMPDFNAAHKELGDEVQFLMVNLTDGSQETQEDAMAFIESEGYTFPVYYDLDMEAAMAYYVYSIPTSFFIDAEGYLAAQAAGSIDRETLELGIERAIKGA